MNAGSSRVQPTLFAVLREPYCLWDVDVEERNRHFLAGLDPGYFDFFVRSVSGCEQGEENAQRIAISLRLAYYHATETLFSLIGALLQAPRCVYAWLAKCQPGNLRTLVEGISAGSKGLLLQVKLPELSWDRIARGVHICSSADPAKAKRTGELFGRFWSMLGWEFLRDEHLKEYNSIKHGFRVRPGGFSLAVGLEKEYGVPAPAEEMQSLGGSEFGSTFYVLERIAGESSKNRSYRSRRSSVNWSLEGTALALQITSMSIGNVLSALRILNGTPPGAIRFTRPVEDDDFERPWREMPDTSSLTFDLVIPKETVRATSKEELLGLWGIEDRSRG